MNRHLLCCYESKMNHNEISRILLRLVHTFSREPLQCKKTPPYALRSAFLHLFVSGPIAIDINPSSIEFFITLVRTQESTLLIGQQGGALAVLVDDLATGEDLTAKQSGYTNSKRQGEQETADGEGKDPLELEEVRLCEELADTGRWSSS